MCGGRKRCIIPIDICTRKTAVVRSGGGDRASAVCSGANTDVDGGIHRNARRTRRSRKSAGCQRNVRNNGPLLKRASTHAREPDYHAKKCFESSARFCDAAEGA